jgi:hypothetical protein
MRGVRTLGVLETLFRYPDRFLKSSLAERKMLSATGKQALVPPLRGEERFYGPERPGDGDYRRGMSGRGKQLFKDVEGEKTVQGPRQSSTAPNRDRQWRKPS